MQELLTNLLPLFKAFHIIGFVAWFAGMFYLVRLFVYHTEAFDKKDPDRNILVKEFNAMEWRVYKIICNPGMSITWIFGILMLFCYGLDWLAVQPWLHLKLILVFLLTGYHHYNKKIIKKLENEIRVMTSQKFRLYNEVPSIFLLAIVILAVYKNGLNYIYAIVGVLLFVLLLVIFTKVYKNIRERKTN
ncbi:MAG: protoporphyrinogen oxidase HemJ [Saprospiraceae bacterium]|nr:protoporphyrinogen oxidase HemJ [Saprospiraceae bacterium]|tara:strand:+ start:911 stop:1477 length:567 start_codon:yes stop_codon:yes gene_type:complete